MNNILKKSNKEKSNENSKKKSNEKSNKEKSSEKSNKEKSKENSGEEKSNENSNNDKSNENSGEEKSIIFDLKGSSYKRKKKQNDKNSPFKDLDFLKEKKCICVDHKQYYDLIRTVRLDVKFLARLNLLDYSLLVSLPDMGCQRSNLDKNCSDSKENTSKNANKDQNSGRLSSSKVTESFRVGIIDFLTKFDLKKKLEYASKRCICGPGISCVPPDYYSDRFLKFVQEKVFKTSFVRSKKPKRSTFLNKKKNELQNSNKNDKQFNI